MVREAREWRRPLKVLRLLARKGPLNKYWICKDLVPMEGSEPTILYLVDKMEQEGLVNVVSTHKKVRGPKPSKYYDLALHGLAELICRLDETKIDCSLLNQLAKKYRDLMPSVFDAWPAILQAGVEYIAMERLQVVCAILLAKAPIRRASYVEEPVLERDGALTEDAADFVMDPFKSEANVDVAPGATEKWLEAVRENSSLRQVSIATLRRVIKYYDAAAVGIVRERREAKGLLETLERADKANKIV